MSLPNDNDFSLTKNNKDEEIKSLKDEISNLKEIIQKMNEEAIQASQTLMQLVSENFNLKDQNQALIAENEKVIFKYNESQDKLEKVTKAGNRLIEIMEEIYK